MANRYEANSALEPGLQEYSAFMVGGFVDIPITLFRTQPEGGLNHIQVVFEDGYGFVGPGSDPLVLELQ